MDILECLCSFFSSRRRHTRYWRDWSSDVCSSDLERETEELHRQGAQLRHIGSLDGLAPDLRQSVLDAIELTKGNDRLILTLAFNYGGRQELVQAVREILASGVPPELVDEQLIGAHLYTRDTPDPD